VTDDTEFKSAGDPFSSTGSPGAEPGTPAPVQLPAVPPVAMPKLWIGYLLALVTFLGEIIAISRHPELRNAKEIKFEVPPLEIFLPAFVTRVYWFVCIYGYHKILAAIPGYKHPITPAKAVGYHFIPFFNFFWVFAWPSAIANFVNARLRAPVMRGWILGAAILGSLFFQLFLDPGFGAALLFVATSYLAGFLKRALSVPEQARQT
jgi:hypothetical protein